MKIGSIGYNYSHSDNFVMDCPGGNGCRLFLLIKEPSIFIIDGTEHKVKENSFVMFSPAVPCRYYGQGSVYTDDWIYFDFEEGDEERFSELGIVPDKIFYLGNIEELSQLVRLMAYEHYSHEPYHEEIERRFTEIFLLKLGRLISTSNRHSQIYADKSSSFIRLRSRLYSMPDIADDVDKMAAEMNMSRSGFQHAYKKIFGVGVKQDIINGRLELAKRLLISTTLSVKEIAERCGYSSEYSFMRQFKERCGQTPTQFRSCL